MVSASVTRSDVMRGFRDEPTTSRLNKSRTIVYACFGIFIFLPSKSNVILRHPWKTKFRGNLTS